MEPKQLFTSTNWYFLKFCQKNSAASSEYHTKKSCDWKISVSFVTKMNKTYFLAFLLPLVLTARTIKYITTIALIPTACKEP